MTLPAESVTLYVPVATTISEDKNFAVDVVASISVVSKLPPKSSSNCAMIASRQYSGVCLVDTIRTASSAYKFPIAPAFLDAQLAEKDSE